MNHNKTRMPYLWSSVRKDIYIIYLWKIEKIRMARYQYIFAVSRFSIAHPEVLFYKVNVEKISELASNFYHFYPYPFIL